MYRNFRESVPGRTKSVCKGPAPENEPGVFVDKESLCKMSFLCAVVGGKGGKRSQMEGLLSGLHSGISMRPFNMQMVDLCLV